MNLDLVDVLRCPRPHEPSTLIATVDRVVGRSVDQGALGCPICDARFPIVEGGVVFDADTRRACRPLPLIRSNTPDAAVRTAALLGLTEPGGVILLGGVAGAPADRVREQTEVTIILHNPPGTMTGWDGVTPIYATPAVPVAAATVRGAMLDARTASRIDLVVAALSTGGRLVAPVETPLPAGVRELARDEREWVAERLATAEGEPVPLRLARAARHAGGP